MDSQRVTALLDKSCATALDDWAQAHGQEIDRNEANEAMKSLEGDLRRNIKPNYVDLYIPSAFPTPVGTSPAPAKIILSISWRASRRTTSACTRPALLPDTF